MRLWKELKLSSLIITSLLAHDARAASTFCYHCDGPIIFNPRIRFLNGKSVPFNPGYSPHQCLIDDLTPEESDEWIISYLQERVDLLSSGLKNKRIRLAITDLEGNPSYI